MLLPPPSGPSKCGTTVIKRFIPENQTVTTKHNKYSSEMLAALNTTTKQPGNSQGWSDIQTYATSRHEKENSLIERDVFQIAADRDEDDLRIFGSRFVDCIKNESTSEAFKKPRFVIQDFHDKPSILTHARTIQRACLRMLLAITASDKELFITCRNVKQAYV